MAKQRSACNGAEVQLQLQISTPSSFPPISCPFLAHTNSNATVNNIHVFKAGFRKPTPFIRTKVPCLLSLPLFIISSSGTPVVNHPNGNLDFELSLTLRLCRSSRKCLHAVDSFIPVSTSRALAYTSRPTSCFRPDYVHAHFHFLEPPNSKIEVYHTTTP